MRCTRWKYQPEGINLTSVLTGFLTCYKASPSKYDSPSHESLQTTNSACKCFFGRHFFLPGRDLGWRDWDKKTHKYFSEFKSENCIYHRKELCRISRSVVKLCCGSIVEQDCRQTSFTAFYRRTSTFVLFELKKLWNHLPILFTLELTKSQLQILFDSTRKTD